MKKVLVFVPFIFSVIYGFGKNLELTKSNSVNQLALTLSNQPISQAQELMRQTMPAGIKKIIEELVNINSGSNNSEGNASVRQRLVELFSTLGFKSYTVEIEDTKFSTETEKVFRHVIVFEIEDSKPDILIIGHTDTVFEKFHPFQKFVDDGAKLLGPGTADMKGGIVLVYDILSQLKNKDLLKRFRIALNDDEELGSVATGPFLKTLADQARFGLIFESGQSADVSTSHSGIIQKEMTVFGVESHAGAAPLQGVNACLENSLKIVEIFKLNKYDRGLTLNPGVINTYAAAKPNVVCGQIATKWDIRYIYPEDLEELNEKFNLVMKTNYAPNPSHKEVKPPTLVVLNQAPGMSPAKTKPLLDIFNSAAARLNIEVVAKHKGGVDAYGIMDSNLSLITGIGVFGDGMHSDKEFMNADLYMRKFVLVKAFMEELVLK
jgi:glutamate carboxypeptidase